MIRANLEDMRDLYGDWIFASTLAVVVGCGMEVPEVLHELWENLFPKRFERTVKITSSIGLLFVVLGVAGELVFEHFRDRYEGLLGEFESILLVDSERQIALTEEEAGNAKDFADAAAIAAGKAKLASDGAVTKAEAAVASAEEASVSAGKAIKEADTFEQGIVSAKKEAADAVSRLADAEKRLADSTQREVAAEAKLSAIKTPRSLVQRTELVNALKPFKGTEYELTVFQDEEAFQLTKALDVVLTQAGWVRHQTGILHIGTTAFDLFSHDRKDLVEVCFETGLSVHIVEPQSSGILQSTPVLLLPSSVRAALALNAALGTSISPADPKNITPGVIDPKEGPERPMTICVGKKP